MRKFAARLAGCSTLLLGDMVEFDDQIREEGFFVVREVMTHAECDQLTDALPASDAAGTRTLMQLGTFRSVAMELRSRFPLDGVLAGLVAVQCTLFQKSSDRNWAVGLHRDDVVAVPLSKYALLTRKRTTSMPRHLVAKVDGN